MKPSEFIVKKVKVQESAKPAKKPVEERKMMQFNEDAANYAFNRLVEDEDDALDRFAGQAKTDAEQGDVHLQGVSKDPDAPEFVPGPTKYNPDYDPTTGRLKGDVPDAPTPEPTKPASNPYSHPSIARIQNYYNKLGVTDSNGNPLKLDGVWGKRSESSKQNFYKMYPPGSPEDLMNQKLHDAVPKKYWWQVIPDKAKVKKVQEENPAAMGNMSQQGATTTLSQGPLTVSATKRPEGTVTTADYDMGPFGSVSGSTGVGFGGAGKDVQQGGNQITSMTNAAGQTTNVVGRAPTTQDFRDALSEKKRNPKLKEDATGGASSAGGIATVVSGSGKPGTGKPKKVGNSYKSKKITVGKGIYK